MALRKILCPIDFSPSSDEALRVAVRIAVAEGAELVVAHVWYIPATAFVGESTYPTTMIGDLLADAEAKLATAIGDARDLGATRLSSVVLDGEPWTAIVQHVEDVTEIDLVVLGTRGRSGITRLVLGSVAEMVVRHAPCSVLAVPVGGAKPFERVLCPVDFSPSSQRALELAGELAPRGAITLLHVVEPPHVYSEAPFALQIDSGLIDRADELLDHWASDLAANRTIVTSTEVRVGRPAAEVSAMLDRASFDLVAMGSHGRTGLRRLVLGSVAEQTVRHAHRAVLVARQPR